MLDDCSCVSLERDACRHYARWIAGFGDPDSRVHALRARRFLSLKMSMDRSLSALNLIQNNFFNTIVSVVGNLPFEGREGTVLPSLPAISEVLSRWMKLGELMSKVPYADSVCVRFVGLEESTLEEMLQSVNTKDLLPGVEIAPHKSCESCARPDSTCKAREGGSLSLFEVMKGEVFDPVADLIRHAVSRKFGIMTDYYRREKDDQPSRDVVRPIDL